jgi:hypothetical protein
MEKQLRKQQTAEIIKFEGRSVSSKLGTYSDKITIDLIRDNKGQPITPRDIARIQYGRVTKRNEAYVRKQLFRVVNYIIQVLGILCYPIYEKEGRHRTKFIKCYLGDEIDQAEFRLYLDKAKARKEITEDKFVHMLELAASIDAPVDEDVEHDVDDFDDTKK